MELSTGIYESLIYEALKKKLDALNKSQYAVNTLSIDSAEVPRLLTNYISKILSRLLTDDKLFESLEERISFINKILHFIEVEWSCDTAMTCWSYKITCSVGLFPERVRMSNRLRLITYSVRNQDSPSVTFSQAAITTCLCRVRSISTFSRLTRSIGLLLSSSFRA